MEATDRITFVKANGAESLTNRVLGTSLRTHMQGAETHHLYKVLLQQIRREGRTNTFSFRCDSPQVRRYLKMTIRPLPAQQVEFSTLLPQ